MIFLRATLVSNKKLASLWRKARKCMRSSEDCVIVRLIIIAAILGVFLAHIAAAQQNERTKEPLDKIITRAENGDAVAQFNVGYAYQTGEGVPKDPTAAIGWYRRAAERGNMGAQFMLGFMYRTGEGVEPNYSEALKWYRKAAENGDGASASEIGAMYEHGVGVAADDQEAARWYKIAADRGEEKGAANLDDAIATDAESRKMTVRPFDCYALRRKLVMRMRSLI